MTGTPMRLRLPAHVHACLFDLDGVLTRTSEIHARAWKEMFDGFLREHAARAGDLFTPFDLVHDYEVYVDGRPRADGLRSFLLSRGIELPEGRPDDPAGSSSVHGMGARKDAIVQGLLATQGVRVYAGSVALLEAVRARGLRTAVVTSSTNSRQVLRAAHLDGLFEVCVDGAAASEQHLRGKPAPDSFLAAARALGVTAEHAAVFEDALAGVEAGRAGGFGYVVGVDRLGQAAALLDHGADVVVSDLADLIEDAAQVRGS